MIIVIMFIFSGVRSISSPYLAIKSALASLRPILARLRNRNATDNDNVDFRCFKKKNCIQSLESKCKVVDLLVQKPSNDMILD